MPGTTDSFTTVLAAWLVAGTLLFWGRLSGRWRRLVALLASGAGLVFLVLAISTEGSREAPTTAVFLIGAPYVTERVSASASLPYYVMTGVCLLLGTAGLAVSDDQARRLSRHWMAGAIGLSLAITALRFVLEKVAAPPGMTQAVGITRLAPLIGAFFALNLRREGKGLRPLVGALLAYGIAVRAPVAALMLAATTLRLGSHYDVSSVVRVQSPLTQRVHEFEPGSLAQVMSLGVAPQLVVWPLYTLLAGLVGAATAVVIAAAWPGSGLTPVRLRLRSDHEAAPN